jgi:hypothetical protein
VGGPTSLELSREVEQQGHSAPVFYPMIVRAEAMNSGRLVHRSGIMEWDLGVVVNSFFDAVESAR